MIGFVLLFSLTFKRIVSIELDELVLSWLKIVVVYRLSVIALSSLSLIVFKVFIYSVKLSSFHLNVIIFD